MCEWSLFVSYICCSHTFSYYQSNTTSIMRHGYKSCFEFSYLCNIQEMSIFYCQLQLNGNMLWLGMRKRKWCAIWCFFGMEGSDEPCQRLLLLHLYAKGERKSFWLNYSNASSAIWVTPHIVMDFMIKSFTAYLTQRHTQRTRSEWWSVEASENFSAIFTKQPTVRNP